MSEHYAGQRISLLTQHGKEQVISPILEPALDCQVVLVSGFDTDQLGTFTRDTPRAGSQRDALRRKARCGMQLSGLPIGLASEGSFGVDPFAGMFPWNIELVMLIDDRLSIEIVGVAEGAGRSGHLQTRDWTEVESFARNQGFPAHHLVLRPQHQNDPRIYKGIDHWDQLKVCFADCAKLAENGQVFLELDLRACAHPSRMQRIGQATQDLLTRIQSCCPRCACPGYWVTERIPGLPCSECALPTATHQSEIWLCLGCGQKSVAPRKDKTVADPQHCANCNP